MWTLMSEPSLTNVISNDARGIIADFLLRKIFFFPRKGGMVIGNLSPENTTCFVNRLNVKCSV